MSVPRHLLRLGRRQLPPPPKRLLPHQRVQDETPAVEVVEAPVAAVAAVAEVVEAPVAEVVEAPVAEVVEAPVAEALEPAPTPVPLPEDNTPVPALEEALSEPVTDHDAGEWKSSMRKNELLEIAVARGLAVTDDDTKAEIVAALKASEV